MNNPIPISALQHYLYCPRQCALIHVEATYDENIYTLRGNRVHERAHESGGELVAGVRLERALPLYSERFGLTGKADVVEFLEDGTPYPVEYKAGSRKKRQADEVQLCAQAICLEEMLDVSIGEGSLYYDRSRRRRIVPFTEELRSVFRETVQRVRELREQNVLPHPVADERCGACSLIDACMPFEVRSWDRQKGDPFLVREVP
ncbi:MAG: CRISPR-associated protein Cas4 [Trueperaceae bacterium]